MFTVLGIDPGLASTGIGVVRGRGSRIESYAYGCVQTDSRSETPFRLDRIFSAVARVIEQENPSLMVIEDVFSLQRYPKSGIHLGKVVGVVMLAAHRRRVPALEVPVREAKKVLTGNGNASKQQLERSIRDLLHSPEAIRPSHASDALGLAVIGLYRHFGPAAATRPGAEGDRRTPDRSDAIGDCERLRTRP